MKTVTELRTHDVEVECPHCGALEEGFCVDPRGGDFECDSCGEKYQVHSDADIEFI